MIARRTGAVALTALVAAGAIATVEAGAGDLVAQVEAVERAFAQTMADRHIIFDKGNKACPE